MPASGYSACKRKHFCLSLLYLSTYGRCTYSADHENEEVPTQVSVQGELVSSLFFTRQNPKLVLNHSKKTKEDFMDKKITSNDLNIFIFSELSKIQFAFQQSMASTIGRQQLEMCMINEGTFSACIAYTIYGIVKCT